MKIHDTRRPRHWSYRNLCECGAESDPSGDQPSDCPVGFSDTRDGVGHLTNTRAVYVPPGFSPYGPYEDEREPLTWRERGVLIGGLILSAAILLTAIFVVARSILS